MAQDEKQNNSPQPENEDIFDGLFSESPKPEDIFADISCLETKSTEGSVKVGKTLTIVLSSFFIVICVFFGFLGWFVYHTVNSVQHKINNSIPAITEQIAQTAALPIIENVKPIEPQIEAEEDFECPVSWAVAEDLYKNRQFKDARKAYLKLKSNLKEQLNPDLFLLDLLDLRIALCLSSYDTAEANKHFSAALESKSPFVNALAHYSMALIQINSRNYMQARQNAYKAICLFDGFKWYVDASFEADCYFLICEAITRQVLSINNYSDAIPDTVWHNLYSSQDQLPSDVSEISSLLSAGSSELAAYSLVPNITSKEHQHTGLAYSAFAYNSPFTEFINKLASASGRNIVWKTDNSSPKVSISVFSVESSPLYIAETVSGTTGFICRFDEPDMLIYDDDNFDNLDTQKELLTKEAISVWRRFLIRYKDDNRAVFANFGWGLMLECSGQIDAAINHYTRTANKYSYSSISPYALLYSSNLRASIADYTGARSDLTQIIMQYNESQITDIAYLNLAQSALESGLYDEAVKSFVMLYNTNNSDVIRAKSAKGAGLSYYYKQEYASADQWLMNCIKFQDQVELDYPNIYFVIGKVKANLGQYEQAAAALVNSLKGNLPTEEHIKIMLELSNAQAKQGKYIEALDTIENIDISNLLQEYVVEILLTKSKILRNMGLAESSLSILRHQLAYIADSQLRAKLSLELSECYLFLEDFDSARAELSDSLKDLKPGETANLLNYHLAIITLKLKDTDRAVEICSMLLGLDLEAQMRKQVYELLGNAYTEQGKYELAALAYSGRLSTTGGQI